MSYEEQELTYEEQELDKFTEFENAESGTFNGYEFVEIFHLYYDKYKAVYSCSADDCAVAHTPFGDFKVHEDGIDCYFMSDKPTKKVEFNRSVYFI